MAQLAQGNGEKMQSEEKGLLSFLLHRLTCNHTENLELRYRTLKKKKKQRKTITETKGVPCWRELVTVLLENQENMRLGGKNKWQMATRAQTQKTVVETQELAQRKEVMRREKCSANFRERGCGKQRVVTTGAPRHIHQQGRLQRLKGNDTMGKVVELTQGKARTGHFCTCSLEKAECDGNDTGSEIPLVHPQCHTSHWIILNHVLIPDHLLGNTQPWINGSGGKWEWKNGASPKKISVCQCQKNGCWQKQTTNVDDGLAHPAETSWAPWAKYFMSLGLSSIHSINWLITEPTLQVYCRTEGHTG